MERTNAIFQITSQSKEILKNDKFCNPYKLVMKVRNGE